MFLESQTIIPDAAIRAIAKVKSGDAAGGNADFAAAKAIKNDIAQQFAK